ncbi:hypothetical protein [Nocardioides sp. Soil805]|uniref:hypothetical protein n=1 Tax=Nocardioides sp. Soil805 TaxID=1736416 RepID=UPI0007025376|nr:hypothetical protein [Nocardioides sp. Soil805]KRF36010.1 hypothetical protein ASG94_00500 [Nocardioides sp. Soil805]
MTMHVKDRLERLSDEAPRELGAPADLWRRGRRRQARQWLAGVGALVVVAVVGGVVADPVLAPGRVEVATPSAELRLPDVFRQPGAWEPAFDGPPGPLAAVGPGVRGGLLTERNAWWGVSGTTGESRFLDLPDAVVGSEADPALSEDGRQLAYWYTGATADEPIVQGDAEPAVGVAVLDLVTGDVQRWDTGTPHGLMTAGLVWAGEVLWWVGGDFSTGGTDEERDGQSSARLVVHTWEPRSDDRGTPEGVGVSMYASGSAPGGALVPGRAGSLRLLVGDEVARRISFDQDLLFQQSTTPALSPSGLLAGVLHEDPSVYDDAPHPVLVGEVDADTGAVLLAPVGDVLAWSVLGWRGPTEVLVDATATSDGTQRVIAQVVDVRSGDVLGPLAEFHGNVPDSFASGVWSADVVDAPDAPFAPDHRLVGLALAGAVLLLVRAGLAVRRRRDRS